MSGFICFVVTVTWFTLQCKAYKCELNPTVQAVVEAVSYVLEIVAVLTIVAIFNYTK